MSFPRPPAEANASAFAGYFPFDFAQGKRRDDNQYPLILTKYNTNSKLMIKEISKKLFNKSLVKYLSRTISLFLMLIFCSLMIFAF